MLAEKNEYIAEAADTIYQLSRDEKIRMECEAREDYYRTQIGIQRKLAKLKELEKNEDKMRNSLVETKGKLEETEGKLEETEGKLEETEGKLEETEGELKETKSKLGEAESKCRMLETEKEALASRMENLIAWAKEHGYDPGSRDGSVP